MTRLEIAPMPSRTLDQRMNALAQANQVREDGARAKREIRVGVLSLADAVEDPRCAAIKVWQLMVSKRGMGIVKANKILSRNGISPNKRVDGLTPRQRLVLADAVESRLAA